MTPATRKLPRGPQAHSYSASGWAVIDNPLHGPDPAEPILEVLRRAGYALQPSMRLEGGSHWASDYHLEVYDGKEFDRFLVCVFTRGPGYTVVVEGMGQLLELLGQLIPILQLAGQTQEKEVNLRREGEPTGGLP